MGKIITMGEIMLRLSTPGQSRFVQTDTFDINYGGGGSQCSRKLCPLWT